MEENKLSNTTDTAIRDGGEATVSPSDAPTQPEHSESKAIINHSPNPYFDQQVQPGQVIGYSIPTNQKVAIPIAKAPKLRGPSKKFLRTVIYFFLILALLAATAALTYIAKEFISF